MLNAADIEILRELGRQVHEIASLPVQAEKRKLWRALNDLEMVRPMVMIDQIPWHEMDIDGSLTCRVQDEFWRGVECGLRQQLYKWRYMPADMVVEDEICVPKAISDSGCGLSVSQDVVVTDERNSVVGHAYHRQIDTMDDIAKLKTPVVTHDEA